MPAGTVTRKMRDAAGKEFDATFWDDGTGKLQAVYHSPALQALVGSELLVTSVQSFTRPATTTAYTAATDTVTGDLVANHATAGSVTPVHFQLPPITAGDTLAAGEISFLYVSTSWSTSKTYRVHLYHSTPPVVSAGDNGALAVSNHDPANYIGFMDVNLQPCPSGGSMGQTDLARVAYSVPIASGSPVNVYALVECLTSDTPASAGTVWLRLGALRVR